MEDTLKIIYDTIDSKNTKPIAQHNIELLDLCRAIWSMGTWTNIHRELWEDLSSLQDKGIIYTIGGEFGGMLHWTLMQLQTFPVVPSNFINIDKKEIENIKEYIDSEPPITIEFKGISRTRNGIFLCGYPQWDINRLRNNIRKNVIYPLNEPHAQDIYHSTLFRFTKEPTEEDILLLDNLVKKYKNTLLANFHANTWEFGYGTWTQKKENRIVVEEWAAKPQLWILHRGLQNGPDKEKENNELIIRSLLHSGWHVEFDIWYNSSTNTMWIGHDKATSELKCNSILFHPRSWVHCKNIETFQYIYNNYNTIHFFYHTDEDIILTSNKYIWCYPGVYAGPKSILVLPEHHFKSLPNECLGVCTDYTSMKRFISNIK